MNTHKLLGLFALLLSLTLILGGMVSGTMAYVAAATPPVSNTFVYDSSVFPDTPTPTPIPTPTPVPTPMPGAVMPDTGDRSTMLLWSTILLLSAYGCTLLYRRRVF